MDTNNRFIKLLTITIDKKELLLYGFSACTNQEPRPWKKKSKFGFNVCDTILPEEDAELFEQHLTETNDVPIGKPMLIAPSLAFRPPVLNYINGWEESGPIYRLCYVSEFRNAKKKELIERVTAAREASGDLYWDIHNVLPQLKSECGIDFEKESVRFGNYERYDRLALECSLSVKIDKDSAGKRLTVQAQEGWNRALIVNCFAESHGRVLFNRIGELLSEDSDLEFIADEAIGKYTVFAWDQETEEAVFFESNTLIHRISFALNTIIGTPCLIHDPWSESLRSSASNRLEIIENSIESVQQRSHYDTIHIGENDLFGEPSNLFFCERKSAKGAFIPNNHKDGEIDSFLKIKEYLDADDVRRAVLADPYFSVLSAQKLLTRITNTGLELTVIASLGSADPDSGEKNNVTESYRRFLVDNAGILHRKLYVYNLHRGKDPVFHDRYLIRYYNDGSIDGFLLSNSLNSMGQFYPFVIAPLETDVCHSVEKYLLDMTDTKAQKKKPKDIRINCEVLFDYQKFVRPQLDPEPKPTGWESRFREREKDSANLPELLNEIQSHWEREPKRTCRVLGSLGYYSHIKTDDVSVLLKKNKSLANRYIEDFSALTKSIESARNCYGADIDRHELEHWMLLTDKAKPNVSGFSDLLDCSRRVFYSGNNWLSTGYDLLLKLDAKRYVGLLEETCSPLMLDRLLIHLMFSSFTKRMYHLLTGRSNKCIRLVGVCWYVNILEYKKPEPSDVFQFLDKLKPDIRLLQLAQMMSEAVFQIRLNRSLKDYWKTIFPQLPKLAASVIPLCSPKGRKLAIDWLHDCEACSCCGLHIRLAVLINETEIRNELYERAIKIISEDILKHSYPRSLIRHISLYLYCIEQRYKGGAEKEMLNNLLDKEAFETATEPELRNYDYTRWHNSYTRACWQLDMLKLYSERHPQAEETIKLLRYWENRMKPVNPPKDYLLPRYKAL